MRSLEMTASWNEEDEDVEVEDMEIRKHSNDGRDDLTESSSDEATGKKRRKHGGSASSGSASSGTTIRRRKTCISARERNLRRLESNERERMRMHSLNDAFEVNSLTLYYYSL
uniref:Class A basic helix-loop-helix protein 15-like n=1 Tax=Diabrotica virgifera virgifera TaxID=50390 RepID=A0A6P7F1I5_DIAVI